MVERKISESACLLLSEAASLLLWSLTLPLVPRLLHFHVIHPSSLPIIKSFSCCFVLHESVPCSSSILVFFTFSPPFHSLYSSLLPMQDLRNSAHDKEVIVTDSIFLHYENLTSFCIQKQHRIFDSCHVICDSLM